MIDEIFNILSYQYIMPQQEFAYKGTLYTEFSLFSHFSTYDQLRGKSCHRQ